MNSVYPASQNIIRLPECLISTPSKYLLALFLDTHQIIRSFLHAFCLYLYHHEWDFGIRLEKAGKYSRF